MKEKIDKAIECFKKQDWNGAIDVFTSIVEIDTDNSEIYNNLGLCYSNIGEYEKAEKNYLKSIELNPQIPQCYINISDLYYKQKRLGEGINILTYAIEMLPNDIIFRHYLARFYMEDAKLDLAIDELEYILNIQPENYDAYYDLAKVYFEFGNYDSAIENFENVLEYKDDNEWIYYYLAEAYQANDEIDKAISNFLKSIAMNNKFPMPYKKVAILFMARGDYEDAIEYLEDYLNFDIPQEEKDGVNKLIDSIKTKVNS
ncbi:MAG: tetratricopeptide repeat protein [Cyanobacteria bacterium SIG26]|nr:tetratricopeptide repeat protein [Cyanobacteria bacterium SIG26]